MDKQMCYTAPVAALFDFDGVIMDTESQYTVFWSEQGRKYLHLDNFGPIIKGSTLPQIYNHYFPGQDDLQEKITCELNEFESRMHYEYLPGVQHFLADLHSVGVRTALVTSSNNDKMQNVYRLYPHFKEAFDLILTSNTMKRSKPAPDCYLTGMEQLGALPRTTCIFEDSFNGLQAARDAGGTVVGLATTNPSEAIREKADVVWDNFEGKGYADLLSLLH